jgi:hypothetical protein
MVSPRSKHRSVSLKCREVYPCSVSWFYGSSFSVSLLCISEYPGVSLKSCLQAMATNKHEISSQGAYMRSKTSPLGLSWLGLWWFIVVHCNAERATMSRWNVMPLVRLFYEETNLHGLITMLHLQGQSPPQARPGESGWPGYDMLETNRRTTPLLDLGPCRLDTGFAANRCGDGDTASSPPITILASGVDRDGHTL